MTMRAIHHRRNLYVAATAIVVAALAAGSARAQPNIIHIIADDLGWVDLSGGATNFGHGSDYYQTPNIDALAARGMSFTSAYAQQNCQPTRAALLTGQYAPRNGVHNVGSLNRAGNDTLLVGPEDGNHVKNEATTVAETLQSAGYTTAHFGKFHVAANRADISTQHGFGLNLELSNNASGSPHMAAFTGGAWTLGQAAYDAYAQPYTVDYIDQHLAPLANGNNPFSLVGTAKHQTDALADAVGDYIASHAEGAAPFYMNVAFNAVHTAIVPRPDLEAKYDAIASTDPRHDSAAYAGFVETLDQAVGRIMAAVDDPNGDGDTADSIAADTLLLFYSDNGGHMGATDNSPLRERKGTLREGGVRVPLIAARPGTIAAGSTSDEAVHAVDFYPTFAEVAGVGLPSPQNHVIDGESFAGILGGQQTELDRDAIFWHFPGYLDDRTVPTSIITKDVGTERYKLLYFYENERYEFFKLSDDLSETTDLLAGAIAAADYDVAREMSVDLRAWLDSQGALYPTVRATGAAVPPPTPLPAVPPLPVVEITFDLSDPAAQGKTTHQIVESGLTLTLTAVGGGAVLDRNSNGVGVNSTADSGSAGVQRRIDGSLTSPEAIHFSFDKDVAITSMLIGSLETTSGLESLELSFISGENPFAGLTGYGGDFDLSANSLAYGTTSGAGTPLAIPFGAGGQSELVLRAGTVLAITANPALDGGVLFDAITIELQPTPGDFTGDGEVDGEDLAVWREFFGATDAHAGMGDANGDRIVDGADFLTWQRQLTGPGAVVTQSPVPEPSAAALASLGVVCSGVAFLRKLRRRGETWSIAAS